MKNQLTHQIKNEVKDFRNSQRTNKLRNINPQDNSLWKMSKVLSKKHQPIPSFEVTNKKFMSDEDKAELLAQNFEEVYKIPDLLLKKQKDIETKITNILDHKIIVSEKELHSLKTTPNEIKEALKRLANNKAPGSDGIQNIILKNLPRKAIVQFMYISECDPTTSTLAK